MIPVSKELVNISGPNLYKAFLGGWGGRGGCGWVGWERGLRVGGVGEGAGSGQGGAFAPTRAVLSHTALRPGMVALFRQPPGVDSRF